jgi:ketosteroid isomerase-like protein
MSRSLRVFLFALLVVSAAVTQVRAADMDARAQALIKLDDEWSKSAATKDAHKVASYYAETALAYPPNAVLASGRDAAEKVWASYFAAAPDFKISWKTTHAEMAKSGDMGYTTGTYEDSYTGADGKTVNEKGKYVCVWAKQKDGSWKAVHDIWNSDTK